MHGGGERKQYIVVVGIRSLAILMIGIIFMHFVPICIIITIYKPVVKEQEEVSEDRNPNN